MGADEHVPAVLLEDKSNIFSTFLTRELKMVWTPKKNTEKINK